MCERSTTNIPNMQLGFIEYVVAPLYMTLFAIFPRALLPLADNLQHNFTHYARVRGEEAPEEKDKLKARVMKFRSKIRESGLEVDWARDEFSEEIKKTRVSDKFFHGQLGRFGRTSKDLHEKDNGVEMKPTVASPSKASPPVTPSSSFDTTLAASPIKSSKQSTTSSSRDKESKGQPSKNQTNKKVEQKMEKKGTDM
jgi:hypothetical protein